MDRNNLPVTIQNSISQVAVSEIQGDLTKFLFLPGNTIYELFIYNDDGAKIDSFVDSLYET